MDMLDMPRKEIRYMNVMELIEKIMEVTKIAALNLWGTDRERTNIAIDECAQEMKDIRLQVNRRKLTDAVNIIEVAFRAMETLTEISNTKAANKNVKNIVLEMLDSDEELTSVSEDDSD